MSIDDVKQRQVNRGCSQRQRLQEQRIADMQATIQSLNRLLSKRDERVLKLEQIKQQLERQLAEAEERCAQWNL